MGEVAALVELHPEDAVAGLQDAEVGGHVRLGTGMRLDVDVLRAREQGERPLLGEPLRDVDVLAAAVVALAGQALGVLVRQPGALRLHDRAEGIVLRGDELDLVVLAAALPLHRRPQVRVDVRDGGPSEARRPRHRQRRAPSSCVSGYRPTSTRRTAAPTSPTGLQPGTAGSPSA